MFKGTKFTSITWEEWRGIQSWCHARPCVFHLLVDVFYTPGEPKICFGNLLVVNTIPHGLEYPLKVQLTNLLTGNLKCVTLEHLCMIWNLFYRLPPSEWHRSCMMIGQPKQCWPNFMSTCGATGDECVHQSHVHILPTNKVNIMARFGVHCGDFRENWLR